MAGYVRVLNVAEKPSVASGISGLLTKGHATKVHYSLALYYNHSILNYCY